MRAGRAARAGSIPRMRDLTARFPRRAGALAGAYAALSAVSSVSAVKGLRRGEAAAKPLLMPVLAAWTLTAAGAADRRRLALPVAGMLLGGLGDTALLAAKGSPKWFLPGMGAFAAGHACYIAALARDGAAGRVRPAAAAGYTAAGTVLLAGLWRGLPGGLRAPVAGYSAVLLSMAALASGRNKQAAAGGALFAVSDALIACGLTRAAGPAARAAEAAVMPSYTAGQFLLAAGWLAPPAAAPEP